MWITPCKYYKDGAWIMVIALNGTYDNIWNVYGTNSFQQSISKALSKVNICYLQWICMKRAVYGKTSIYVPFSTYEYTFYLRCWFIVWDWPIKTTMTCETIGYDLLNYKRYDRIKTIYMYIRLRNSVKDLIEKQDIHTLKYYGNI